MRGFQAEGAAPLVTGEPFPDPETMATAIRIGNPASWKLAEAARRRVRRPVRGRSPTTQILAAQRELAAPRRRLRRAGLGGRASPACSPTLAAGRRRTPAARSSSPSPATGSRTPTPRCRRSRDLVDTVVDADVDAAAAAAGLALMTLTFVDGPVRVSVPATLGQPRPGLRLPRPRARPARRRSTAEVVDGRASTVEVAGEGAGRRAARRAPPRGPRRCAPPSSAMGAAAAGPAADLPQRRSRTPAASGRRPPRSSAGVVLARGAGRGRRRCCSTTTRCFALAADLEGHPDNVAPALLGGFVDRLAATDGAVRAVRARGRPAGRGGGVRAARRRCRTEVARGLLPDDVPHADAAANAGRAALLVAALAGSPSCCSPPPRTACTRTTASPAMPESLALVDALRADGLPAVVSGAGPDRAGAVTDGEPATRCVARRCPAGWRALAVRRRPVTAPGSAAGVSRDPPVYCSWRRGRPVLGCRCAGDRGAHDAPTQRSDAVAHLSSHSRPASSSRCLRRGDHRAASA